ncbi:MAG: type II secretion system protein [Candidatus Ancaeobacter aquaticus]|nr:type II secretion system protein [Candidatus Ancaeobacter aquaticus]
MSKVKKMKKGFTLVELLVVIAIIGILVGLLLPGLNRARKQALKLNCQSNLRQIGIAIKSYQNDYDQAYPPTISALGTDYLDNVQVFRCPSSGTAAADVTGPASGDYGYNKGLSEATTSDCPMASDKKDTYHPAPKKVNVLFVDGHVGDDRTVPSTISNPD